MFKLKINKKLESFKLKVMFMKTTYFVIFYLKNSVLVQVHTSETAFILHVSTVNTFIYIFNQNISSCTKLNAIKLLYDVLI